MTFDLEAELPALIPKAIAWAEEQALFIEQAGEPLDEKFASIALEAGVKHPERIRIFGVAQLPLPGDPELKQAALATGLLGSHMAGMTFEYGIYICHGQRTIRLLSHEFRHVHQYEQAGSIALFLPMYLQQIATVGYDNAPYELDARAHEKHVV